MSEPVERDPDIDAYQNDFQMVDLEAASAAWNLLHGTGPFRNGQELEQQGKEVEVHTYKAFQTPDSMRGLAFLIRANRRETSGPWRTSCGRYPALMYRRVTRSRDRHSVRLRLDACTGRTTMTLQAKLTTE
jgi:hypothetical protein